jgi:predicted transcriptional regulator
MLAAILSKEEKMRTAKEEVRRMLDQIPDDATFEDIQYHIYVREKIERGLKDIQEGHLLSQEEIEQRMSKWLGK